MGIPDKPSGSFSVDCSIYQTDAQINEFKNIQ
jgi:hypothetical protein